MRFVTLSVPVPHRVPQQLSNRHFDLPGPFPGDPQAVPNHAKPFRFVLKKPQLRDQQLPGVQLRQHRGDQLLEVTTDLTPFQVVPRRFVFHRVVQQGVLGPQDGVRGQEAVPVAGGVPFANQQLAEHLRVRVPVPFQVLPGPAHGRPDGPSPVVPHPAIQVQHPQQVVEDQFPRPGAELNPLVRVEGLRRSAEHHQGLLVVVFPGQVGAVEPAGDVNRQPVVVQYVHPVRAYGVRLIGVLHGPLQLRQEL